MMGLAMASQLKQLYTRVRYQRPESANPKLVLRSMTQRYLFSMLSDEPNVNPTDQGGENSATNEIPAAAPANQQMATANPQEEPEERYCWVCFATEEDDKFAPWVQPCNCRGATKWVHQSCLKRWIDEKQKGNPYKSISCPQCQTRYIIILPSMGSFAFLLERLDIIAKQLSPGMAAGAIVCSIYWSAITFGAVTVLQTTGFERGLSMMEQAEPIALLLCLPTIPVALVIGRMFRWEDIVLRFLQNRQFDVRNNEPSPNYPEVFPSSTISASEPLSVTRIFCGALLLPTVSNIVGKIFFKSVKNDLHRTLLGGFAFVVVKGVLKIYFHQKKHYRAKQRQILDYTPENVRKYWMRSQPPEGNDRPGQHGQEQGIMRQPPIEERNERDLTRVGNKPYPGPAYQSIARLVFLRIVHRINKAVSETAARYRLPEIAQAIFASLQQYPILALAVAIVIFTFTLPFLVFIFFTITTAVMAFTGFVLIEGALITAASVMLI
uniref:E3 ubiquitin-protein ligase MARCHF5 n=1 Tax=Anopheles culicifacies TaxID=139723 RepID=A0A182M7T7_9DIPT